MKNTIIPRHLLFLIIPFCIMLSMCGKSDSPTENPGESPNLPLPAVDPALAYVIMNVEKTDKSNNLIYPTPTDYEFRTYPQTSGMLQVTSSTTDTVKGFWLFNVSRIAKDPPLPMWGFCDKTYQAGATDQYVLSFYWSASASGKTLQTGKMYNLNMRGNTLATTQGLVFFTHKKNNVIIKEMITYDEVMSKSWIKFDSISGGKGSGSFLFEFTCANPGGAGGRITNVTGRFGNIPIN